MVPTLVALFCAALFEVGGIAAIRYGLVRPARGALLAGSLALVVYGFVVNTNRGAEFGRLMGVYIATFYLVSQVIGVVVFGDRPAAPVVLGGVLIVGGGLVIQLAAR